MEKWNNKAEHDPEQEATHNPRHSLMDIVCLSPHKSNNTPLENERGGNGKRKEKEAKSGRRARLRFGWELNHSIANSDPHCCTLYLLSFSAKKAVSFLPPSLPYLPSFHLHNFVLRFPPSPLVCRSGLDFSEVCGLGRKSISASVAFSGFGTPYFSAETLEGSCSQANNPSGGPPIG